MAPDVAILTLDDRQRWEEIEAAGAMPSQCWRFAAALACSGYEPRLAVVDADGSRLVLPFTERRWREHADIATLPGLSGASVVPASARPFVRWHQVAAAIGWVCGYIQLCPVTAPNVPSGAGSLQRTHAFVIDPSTWDRRRTPSTIVRRKIAAATRRGATIASDPDAVREAFWPLYLETLSRFGSRPAFTAETLDRWARDPMNLVVGVILDGRVEGAHLVHVHGNHAEVHLVVASVRGRPCSALLYAETLDRLRDRNVTCCNLGGGGNPGDGLYTFKSWLGARPVPLSSVQQVYDSRAYEALCRAAGQDAATGYFPGYRLASNG